MTDAEIIAQWSRVTDPKEALRLIVENEMFFGYDHYYRDLREALIDMAVRCGGMEPQPTNSELLRAAGYTQRDTSLECDECGRKFSTQMLPIHKCEPIDPHMIAAEDRYPSETAVPLTITDDGVIKTTPKDVLATKRARRQLDAIRQMGDGSNMQPTEAQITAAAKELCQCHAEGCGVDPDDEWKVYCEEFLTEATRVLRAALAAKENQR